MTDPAKKTDKKEAKPKRKKNYLNNKDMMAELGKCHEQDKMTDEFAKMIMLLAERYGSRYEYSDYSPHIEDMKSVAVANVVRAWRSFDLSKYNNPFAYFTQAIKHTFWQYVSQEKKHRLNRDAILISQGELPSDAYMEDYHAEMEELRRDVKNMNEPTQGPFKDE
jgi:DNA-directed RNA polymerase specialized sigma subunit